SGATKVCDGDQQSPCSVSNYTAGYKANHMNVYTGNAVPPATDGLIKGFTINTDDQGQVSFCGRLQRPDITPSNLTDPHPNNCQPNGPTMTVLGTTINGRHIYYWLHDWARQAFYPEVWNTENSGNRGQLTLNNSVYDAANPEHSSASKPSRSCISSSRRSAVQPGRSVSSRISPTSASSTSSRVMMPSERPPGSRTKPR